MRFMHGGAGAMAVLLLTLSGCVSSEFAAINTEPGYYYGFGSGASEAAAQDVAFQDLVYNTFTETGSIAKDKKTRVVLTAEMKAALTPLAAKPFLAEKKSPTSFTAVYRVKYTDWTKAEDLRLAALRTQFGGRFTALSSDTKSTLGARLIEAVRITQGLEKNGVPLSLRVGGPDTALLSASLAQWAKDQLAGATFRFAPEGGLVGTDQPVAVTLVDKAGKPLAGIPFSAVWELVSGSAPALVATTDAKGIGAVDYPTDVKYRNAKPALKVTSKIASLVADASFLASLDGLKGEASYRNAYVAANLKTDEVRVEGGTVAIGAVKQDRRAGGKEKARTVTVKSFYMDLVPVTNAQFRSYLETSDVPRAEWPDFLSDETLSGPNQPVVGITFAEAQKYADWVSGQLGVKKRLPTEEEYEVAARAGQGSIYPWGDQAPTDGVRANYSGNKKFDSTSPVGSFANGANPLGLLDMVGNVWEWTSSGPDAQITAEPQFKIIKGGSWLDGPSELRISNRRAVDPAETASDLGFRLVREDNQ